MSGNSVVNLGELSKPATVLVEKISDAVGGIFKPYQIRRVARAEAEAERIRAESAIEITQLQQRAFHRWLAEEAKKQDNIETITSKALPGVDEKAEPQRVEDDWITHFFDKARLISDDEMQALWAQVLAGEANTPGTYSKRTVSFLASLDREDARLFSALCRSCWNVGKLVPVVFDVDNAIYIDAGITSEALTHLDSIGLIRYQWPAFAGFEIVGDRAKVEYYGSSVELEFREHGDHFLNIGHVLLSKVGMELAPLCGAAHIPGFLEYTLSAWRSVSGAIPSSPLPRHTTIE